MIRGRILQVSWDNGPEALAELAIDPTVRVGGHPVVILPDPITGTEDWQDKLLARIGDGTFCGGTVSVTAPEGSNRVVRAVCSIHGPIDSFPLGPPTSQDLSCEIRTFLIIQREKHQAEFAADLIRFLVAERDRPVSWWRRRRAGIR